MDNLDWLEFSPRKDGTLPPKPGGAPTDAAGFALEARRLRRAGHFHAAAMHYAQSVGLQEHQFSVWAALIDCLIRAGRTQEADAKSREVLDAFRKVRELYASRALALVYAGQLEAARPLLDVALEGNRPHWYASVVRGEFILRETPKRVRTAVDAFEQAIALAEDGWEPCFLGGWVLLRAGCAAPAAGFFAEAVHQDPKAAASLIGLGDAFRALRLYDQAAFYYECAQALNPDDKLAQERLKQCRSWIYGLMRVFTKRDLRARWKAEYEMLKSKVEWTNYEL